MDNADEHTLLASQITQTQLNQLKNPQTKKQPRKITDSNSISHSTTFKSNQTANYTQIHAKPTMQIHKGTQEAQKSKSIVMKTKREHSFGSRTYHL